MKLTKNLKFNHNMFIHSADFESLYTNIPLNEAIIIISDFYMNNSIDGLSSFCFNTFLKLVLENNYLLMNFMVMTSSLLRNNNSIRAHVNFSPIRARVNFLMGK